MGQTETIIPEKIFFKIGEVCELVGVQAHVLRYWETEFPMLSPKKNRSGQRSYRRKDVEIALSIKDLLYEDLYTIAGAKKKLQAGGRSSAKSKPTVSEPVESQVEKGGQPSLLDMTDEAGYSGTEDESGSVEKFSLDSDRRDALKSLVSELLELREMLKIDGNSRADKEFNRTKSV